MDGREGGRRRRERGERERREREREREREKRRERDRREEGGRENADVNRTTSQAPFLCLH